MCTDAVVEGLGLVMKFFLIVVGVLFALDAYAKEGQWRLVYEETFARPLSPDRAEWRKATPGDADPMDDAGQYFKILGGPQFEKQLRTFDTYRKTYSFGKDGWLTAELSARDPGKAGKPKDPPSLTATKIGKVNAVRLNEPDHYGGILIRSTQALPAKYRIEYELLALDFGGSRDGKWNYKGKTNGYSAGASKTRHPWPFSKSDEFAKPESAWHDVKIANGFYFLAIVDYPDPYPRNNVFIHNHRKVAIDAYNVREHPTFEVCNPAAKTYYVGQDNTVNMLFLSPGGAREGQSLAVTECGTVYGGEGGRAPVVSAVQMLPELRPKRSYRFAVERDETGYTLEVRGQFRFVGEKTYRYHRGFTEDRHPIWHFNQQPAEYDGGFDKSFQLEGPHGKFTIEHSWPKGSAYPDYFIIGDPHTNYYEGSAALTNIRLYTPR